MFLPYLIATSIEQKAARSVSKRAVHRAVDALGACGVTSAVAQRAVLTEVRMLLRRLFRSDRLVAAARRRKGVVLQGPRRLRLGKGILED